VLEDESFEGGAAIGTCGHSRIWSARPNTDGGIVRSTALAVLRLLTNSNFVGCSTGRSAGLAPLRIRSVALGRWFSGSSGRWVVDYDPRGMCSRDGAHDHRCLEGLASGVFNRSGGNAFGRFGRRPAGRLGGIAGDGNEGSGVAARGLPVRPLLCVVGGEAVAGDRLASGERLGRETSLAGLARMPSRRKGCVGSPESAVTTEGSSFVRAWFGSVDTRRLSGLDSGLTHWLAASLPFRLRDTQTCISQHSPFR